MLIAPRALTFGSGSGIAFMLWHDIRLSQGLLKKKLYKLLSIVVNKVPGIVKSASWLIASAANQT